MRTYVGFLVFSLFLLFVAVPLLADSPEGKPNCKLTTQIFMKSGKKKLDVDVIHTPSRQVCAAEAETRRLALDEDAEEVENTKVVFSWHDFQ